MFMVVHACRLLWLVRRSPHRFELVLKDPQVIGMRRTAQVLMGKALQSLGDSRDVKAALNSALDALAAESNVISLAQLRQADSQTTAAIIRAFSDNAVFREVSLRTADLTSMFAITYHHSFIGSFINSCCVYRALTCRAACEIGSYRHCTRAALLDATKKTEENCKPGSKSPLIKACWKRGRRFVFCCGVALCRLVVCMFMRVRALN